MQKILLTGATGYVGSHLLPRLKNVRCLVRDANKAPEGVSSVEGDVFDYDSLEKALDGIDVAYYLIHSMEVDNFVERDRLAAENFARAAEACRVKRIIYLGGLGDDETGLSPHLKSRHEVGEVLRKNAPSVQIIEFRASIVIGSGSLSFEMVRALCERLPFMITPKWVWAKAQPIAIQDLLEYLLEALEIQVEGNQIYEIGGKDQVSYAEIMREYSRQREITRFMVPVPVITPYLSSLWLGLVTPFYANVGRKLIESACHPTIVMNPNAERVFHVHPMGIREAIAEALSEEESGRFIDKKEITVDAPPDIAFAPIRRIGGKVGWYWGNGLWQLRGLIDLMVGGVGLRRGRINPEELQVGDHLDFWTVEAYEPNRFLRLRAEMKVPGSAWLEFTVQGVEAIPNQNEESEFQQSRRLDFEPGKAGGEAAPAKSRGDAAEFKGQNAGEDENRFCNLIRYKSTIVQKAIFHPRGLFGLLYWYGLYPIHTLVFAGMIRGIAYAAEQLKKETHL